MQQWQQELKVEAEAGLETVEEGQGEDCGGEGRRGWSFANVYLPALLPLCPCTHACVRA